jgi:single-strand DNA-binding protein
MFSLNRVTLIGNLTRDPELRYTPNGQAVAGYAIATNRRWTSQSGETQDATEYHEIVAWGKLAEISQQLLSKGKKAYVEGRLQTRSWDAPDGSKRQRTEIIAENIIALSPRSGGAAEPIVEATPENSAPPSRPKKTESQPKSTPPKQESGSNEDEIDLSDLPF